MHVVWSLTLEGLGVAETPESGERHVLDCVKGNCKEKFDRWRPQREECGRKVYGKT